MAAKVLISYRCDDSRYQARIRYHPYGRGEAILNGERLHRTNA
jgi:hypothetical protein